MEITYIFKFYFRYDNSLTLMKQEETFFIVRDSDIIMIIFLSKNRNPSNNNKNCFKFSLPLPCYEPTHLTV